MKWKKLKAQKKCIVKREITVKNYAKALFNDEVIITSQQRFRSNHHRVYNEEVDKIAVSSNDDKRIQTLDKVTTYMEQMHLKCVEVKCYQKINGALIKLYYLQQKYQSDNTNMSRDFGGNTYSKINKWQYK